MQKISRDEEKLPIAPPLSVMRYKTINKRFGWWSVVALIESWGRKQVCFYLWQKRGDAWRRKQKFAIHSQEDWQIIQESIGDMITELS